MGVMVAGARERLAERDEQRLVRGHAVLVGVVGVPEREERRASCRSRPAGARDRARSPCGCWAIVGEQLRLAGVERSERHPLPIAHVVGREVRLGGVLVAQHRAIRVVNRGHVPEQALEDAARCP